MYGQRQTDEEHDVRRALQKYTDDWPAGDPRRLHSFIPTKSLYAQYKSYMLRHPIEPGDSPTLSAIQFGIVLRRVFPELADLPNGGRAKRQYWGKRVWGIVGLWGPGCAFVYGCPGRPAEGPPDFDEPELGARADGFPFVRPY